MVMTEPGPEGRAPRRRERRSWMASLPLLVIPLLAYVGFAGAGADFAASRFDVTMPSGGVWQIGLGDILLVVGLGLLFFEILKATRTGNSIVDHALSMIVFVVCLILFLIWDRAATSTFLLLMLMTMIDVIAGFSVTINAARRDYSVGGSA